ncbi:MAG: hypothetical protein F9K29_22410 [Hyphomicrobiaceae bacterium]|nr:MAG: hypothetical protein F9K29_22410 [Hyphomicrobiaceae bacterium]
MSKSSVSARHQRKRPVSNVVELTAKPVIPERPDLDLHEVESHLLDLEGILRALEIVIQQDAFNSPSAECHALHVLVDTAQDTAGRLRTTLWPRDGEPRRT